MDDFDDMEGKDKKPKEYYQVNLDMGRIFWIVFLLGVVIIGIFVLGFFAGGGKEKGKSISIGSKKEKTSGEIIVNKIFGENGKTKSQVKSGKNKVDVQEIFKQHPEGEMQVVSKESVAKALKEDQSRSIAGKSNIQKQSATSSISRQIKSSSIKKSYYKSTGKYYIQVASFKKQENASSLKKELEKNLYKVRIEETKVGGEHYFRVRVGPFSSKSIAKNTMIAMKRRFSLRSPFIVKKSS